MKLQTHAKLYIRELIDNWKYIDSIIFLIILLMYVGFTDPCDRCMVNLGSGEQSCKDAFLNKIGYEEINGVIKKIDYTEQINNMFYNLTNISIT
jgi:hypothetical protein